MIAACFVGRTQVLAYSSPNIARLVATRFLDTEVVAYILYSGNKLSVSTPPSRLLISDQHGVPLDDPTSVLNSAYPGRNSHDREGESEESAET